MRCLSCEKEILEEGQYHKTCARALFGKNYVPNIMFKSVDILSEAQKLIGRMSISGVQEKLSVSIKNKTLEVAAPFGSHILKPSPARFPYLAENENVCMNLSREFSIETPPHGLLPLADGRWAYIIKRFDRSFASGQVSKIHVEDFAQLLLREDKYSGSMEQIGKFIIQHSEIPFIDTQKLFSRVLFNFLIGNGDAHLKNFSMINSSGWRLAPAYDLVSSRLVMLSEADEMALPINGKKNNIAVKDFQILANYLEIGEKPYRRLMHSAKALKAKIKELVYGSFLPHDFQNKFIEIFEKRHERLW